MLSTIATSANCCIAPLLFPSHCKAFPTLQRERHSQFFPPPALSNVSSDVGSHSPRVSPPRRGTTHMLPYFFGRPAVTYFDKFVQHKFQVNCPLFTQVFWQATSKWAQQYHCSFQINDFPLLSNCPNLTFQNESIALMVILIVSTYKTFGLGLSQQN